MARLRLPGRFAARPRAGRRRGTDALRLERGWTQQEMAERSGLTLATYRRFERTGRIALERLLRIAAILDARGGFDHLFALPPGSSLADLAERSRQPKRQRGRRNRAERVG